MGMGVGIGIGDRDWDLEWSGVELEYRIRTAIDREVFFGVKFWDFIKEKGKRGWGRGNLINLAEKAGGAEV